MAAGEPLWMKLVPRSYRGFVGFVLAACSFGALIFAMASAAVARVDDRVHRVIDPLVLSAKRKHSRYDRILAQQTVLLQHLLEDTENAREAAGLKKHSHAELAEEISRTLEFERKYGATALGSSDEQE